MTAKSTLIVLDSRDSELSDNYRTYFLLNSHHHLQSHAEHQSLSVLNVELHNTVYPINANNNLLKITEVGGGVDTITITENYYTGTTLATEIQTQLNAAAGLAYTYTVTYDSTTKKITIDTGNGAQTITYNSIANDILVPLGMDLTDSTSTQTKVSSYPIIISGTRYVDVVSNLQFRNIQSGRSSNVLVRVPMTVPFGNTLFYEPNHHHDMYVKTAALHDFQIELYDDNGNFWELPPNAYFSITLLTKDA